jgi:rhomboid protease GluP
MRQRPEAVCTIILIAVNVAVFFILSLFGDTEDAVFMMQHGAMYSDFVIQDHEYYRLFTCLFLHFGIEHLLNNMVILGALGWNLELQTGKIRFLLIYFGSGLFGNVVSLIFHGAAQEYTVSAGASGAIFGLMGALLWVVIANHGRLGRLSGRGMLVMVALSLYFGLSSSGVDNYAHIGGLVCGFLLALILYRMRSGRDGFENPIRPEEIL